MMLKAGRLVVPARTASWDWHFVRLDLRVREDAEARVSLQKRLKVILVSGRSQQALPFWLRRVSTVGSHVLHAHLYALTHQYSRLGVSGRLRDFSHLLQDSEHFCRRRQK